MDDVLLETLMHKAAMWLDVGVLVAGLASLVLLGRSLRHLRRAHFGRAGSRAFGGLLLGAAALLALLLGVNILSYSRLTAETPVAELAFRQLGPQHYAVRLRASDGEVLATQLRGDAWQIDARVIKWRGAATVIGLPPLYRLERLSGRYTSIEQARTTLPSVVGLSREAGLSLWDAARRIDTWLPLVDARYGSATYLPMADGARYSVSLSPTGLLARPTNAAAAKAVADWR